MSSVKGAIADTFGRFVFKEARVVATQEHSAHFRRLDLSFDWLRGVGFDPGDKLQILIPREGAVRTYTPYNFDSATGRLSILAYMHGASPGAAWARSAKVNEGVRVFGPRGSIALRSISSGPAVLFGDETSFALGLSLSQLQSNAGYVFEVSSANESRAMLQLLGLQSAAVIEKRPDDSHLAHVETALGERLNASSTLVMTGRAKAIQDVRWRLKANRVAHAGQKVKAYWAVGKVGLD